MSSRRAAATFQGSVFFNITPGVLEGAPKAVRRQGETIQTDETPSSIRDYGFEVGGPILKDKLWFYAGADLAFKSNSMERNLFATRYDPTTFEPVTDPETGLNVVDRLPGTQALLPRRGADAAVPREADLPDRSGPQRRALGLRLALHLGRQRHVRVRPAAGRDRALEHRRRVRRDGARVRGVVHGRRAEVVVWRSTTRPCSSTRRSAGTASGTRGCPPDGSELGTRRGPGGRALMVWQRVLPQPVLDRRFRGLSPEARAMCEAACGRGERRESPRLPCAVRHVLARRARLHRRRLAQPLPAEGDGDEHLPGARAPRGQGRHRRRDHDVPSTSRRTRAAPPTWRRETGMPPMTSEGSAS